MPMDPMADKSQPLYAAILMTLAAGVVLGASLAGRAVFSRIRHPEPKPPVTETAVRPMDPVTREPSPATETVTNEEGSGNDAVRSFVDATVKSALTGTGVDVLPEDAAALKEAPKDPAVHAAVGGALKASAEQSAPLLRRAMDAVWKAITSFIKVKVTVKEETP